MVDDTTNLTEWFLSTNDDPQDEFNGVELTKNNGSLEVSFRDGRLLILLHCSYVVLYRYRGRF